MSDNRLFHRYTAKVKVAFRVRGASHRGSLTNVSAGGGFVATKALPETGARIQMAAVKEQGASSIWLDLRVCWLNEQVSEEHPDTGFGGFWLHACSRESEEHLREFLDTTLGITRPVVRPVSPPSGGDTVYMYRFPDVYEGSTEEEFPWLEGRALHRPVSDVRQRDSADPSWLGTELPPVQDSVASPLPILAPTQPLPQDPVEFDPGPPPAEPAEAGGRWGFLARKLTGVTFRRGKEPPAEVKPGPKPVTVTTTGEGAVQYKIARKAFTGRMTRMGTGWLVFETVAEVPALWSRIVVEVPVEGPKKVREIEIHAQVTRIKQGGADGAPTAVHCKVIRLDERGATGAYAQYMEAFTARTGGSP